MFKKILIMAVLATSASTTLFAQRDFKRERAELDREEREERRARMREERRERSHTAYGANILRLSPLTLMDVGVGFGLSYERFLDKQQMVGLILPVHLLLEDSDEHFLSGNNYYQNEGTHAYVYFTPGIKIYPFGQRRVTYAVGPSLLLGYGGGKEWRYDGYYPYGQRVDVTRFRLGMMVNNYVNFQIGPSFNLGLELGLGVRYLDRETVDYEAPFMIRNTTNNGIEATGQFSMTLGYRF
jgi:hypothetical protein